MKKNRDYPVKQIFLWQEYRGGFVKKNPLDILLRFQKGKRAGAEAFWEYAEKQYLSFGYKIPFQKAHTLMGQLSKIIHGALLHLPKEDEKVSFECQSYVHSYQHEECRNEQISENVDDLVAEIDTPLPVWLTLDRQDFTEQFAKQCQSVMEVFGSKHLTKNLWITPNALKTAKNKQGSLGVACLKPIQYILVVQKLKSWYAFALADVDASHFLNLFEKGEMGCQIALLGKNGEVVKNEIGEGAFALHVFKEPFVEDVLIDIALMQCQLRNPLRYRSALRNGMIFGPCGKR